MFVLRRLGHRTLKSAQHVACTYNLLNNNNNPVYLPTRYEEKYVALHRVIWSIKWGNRGKMYTTSPGM